MSNFGTSKVQFLVTGIRLQEGTAGPSTLGLCALDDDGARAVHSFSGCAARVLSLQSTFFETLLVLAKILRGFVAARSRLQGRRVEGTGKSAGLPAQTPRSPSIINL